MGSYQCAQGFTISSQEEIDKNRENILSCGYGALTPNATFINVNSPSTDLVLPEGTRVTNITLSNVQRRREINASGVDHVDTLFMVEYYNGVLNIPVVPNDKFPTWEKAEWTNSQFDEVYLDQMLHVSGNATRAWRQTNGSSMMNDFKILESLYVENGWATLLSLTNVTYSLEIVGGSITQLTVPALGHVGNATFRGQSLATQLNGLQVAGSLKIELGGGVVETTDEITGKDIYDYEWNVVSIGKDLVISAIFNATLTMPILTSVANQLLIQDSNNCTFAFAQLTNAKDILMENNVNSPLPGDFRNLEFADSIHLRGYVDTSLSGNIFPSLKLVRESVTIEAWNADFNCSKLVSQQRQGIINHLYCNGTDNGNTTTSSSTPPPSNNPNTSPDLSTGAWAGIGVGIAVFVLGVIGLVTWTILHFRSKIRRLEDERARAESDALKSTKPFSNIPEPQEADCPPVEMSAGRMAPEMDAPRKPVEAHNTSLVEAP
ncbi:hypothetical protein F4808DRAFT_440334 [Astrocystis sublimbata]|nr:hypothetical protein F4808DRAFT_440334 [Astrocystis sublimbata]